MVEVADKNRDAKQEPMVSILMPVYSPRFFEEALVSAIKQTYEQIEIFVSDDSPNEEIKEIVDKYQDCGKIRYLKNTPAQGPYFNYVACMSAAKGKYIKFLNDDDVLSESCVEKMVRVLDTSQSVVLVTSARICINEQGQPVRGHLSTEQVFDNNCIVQAKDMCTSVVKLRLNLIGEPSTTMFRQKLIGTASPNLMCWGERPGYGAGDVAMWLNLLQHGDVYYFAEALSQFRLHPGQRQHSDFVRLKANATWKWFLKHGQDCGAVAAGMGWFVRVRDNEMAAWKWVKIASLKMIVRQLILPVFQMYLALRHRT